MEILYYIIIIYNKYESYEVVYLMRAVSGVNLGKVFSTLR